MKGSPPSLLPALCTHCVSGGKGSCHVFHVCSPAAAALHRAGHTPARSESFRRRGSKECWLLSLHSIWNSGLSPMLLWVHQLFHAFSSLLVFILPVSVMGISCRRNCNVHCFWFVRSEMVHCHDAMDIFETFQAVVLECMFWMLPTTKRAFTDFCFEEVHMINLKSILSSTDVFL